MKIKSNSFFKSMLIYTLILFFFVILFSHLTSNFLDSYLEESAYYWRWTEKREIQNKRYKLIVLGDSQWISGLDFGIFATASGLNPDSILIYAKPSQQPEGIYSDIEYLNSQGISSDYYFINLSPTSTTKNDVFHSYKPLQLNFGKNSYKYLFSISYWKIFYNDLSAYLFHGISYIFPVIQYNSHISSISRLIPVIEEIDANSTKMEIRTGSKENWLEYYSKRKDKNIFLESKLQPQGLWEWKNYNQSSIDCKDLEKKKALPIEMKIAFSKIRPEATEELKKIHHFLEKKGSKLTMVHIPFTTEMEKLQTVFPILLRDWQEKKEFNIEFIPSSLFTDSDYSDYTHFNRCGAYKFSSYLGKNLKDKL